VADVLGGINVGMCLLGKPGEEKTIKAIGLSWSKAEIVDPDHPENPDNYEDIFITLAGAKRLILDIQGAIDEIVKGRAFSDEE